MRKKYVSAAYFPKHAEYRKLVNALSNINHHYKIQNDAASQLKLIGLYVYKYSNIELNEKSIKNLQYISVACWEENINCKLSQLHVMQVSIIVFCQNTAVWLLRYKK